MSAQDEGLLRMHADNLFGGIPFDYSQIKRHSGNIERVTGSGNFTASGAYASALTSAPG